MADDANDDATASTPPPPPDDGGGTTTANRNRLIILAAVAAAIVLVGAVLLLRSGDDEEVAEPTTTTVAETTTTTVAETTTTTEAEPEPEMADPAYAEPGPYAAGVTSFALDDGRFVEVWYPADPAGTAGVEPAVFEIRDVVPPELASLVPDELNPEYVTDAYPDVPPAAGGPFPVLGFSHGFAGYPTMYQFLGSHLATWGIVMVAPDHVERDLFAAVSGQITEGDDAAVLLAAVDAAVAAAEGPLVGLLDGTRIATAGHSAGVRAATTAAVTDDRVAAVVAFAGGSEESDVPEVPTLAVAGGLDGVIPLDRIIGFVEQLPGGQRFVVVDEAGHNAFTDICLIGREQGGLLGIVDELGLAVDERLLGLFSDGCTAEFLPAEEAWPAARHVTTAHLRAAWGIDDEPRGLDDATAAGFAPVGVSWWSGPG